jgi:hypothetical protein
VITRSAHSTMDTKTAGLHIVYTGTAVDGSVGVSGVYT